MVLLNSKSLIWADGGDSVLYSTDIHGIRDLMRRKDVRLWGEYFDPKGRLFALQVKLPQKSRDRVMRLFKISAT